MERIFNPYFWIYTIFAMVWFVRARLALAVVKKTPRVPTAKADSQNAPLISIIVPARNEETNIEDLIQGLLNQTHTNLEILIANDNSTDKTEEILLHHGFSNIEKSGFNQIREGLRIGSINVPGTPEGWTGKNHALHYAAPHTQGDWILFTDADTKHSPESIASAYAYVQEKNIQYLTLTPMCLTKSFFEHLIQPTAMAFLGMWFPLHEVNQLASKKVFGNGQFLFIQRKIYKKIGGHHAVKEAFLEDYAITEKVKEHKVPFQCAFGEALFSTHMYNGLMGTWNGWRRIYLHAFKQNPFPLLKNFMSTIGFSIFPFALMFQLSHYAIHRPELFAFSWGLAFMVNIFITIVTWKAYRIFKAKPIYALLHPFAAVFIAMILLEAFWMAMTNKKTKWR